MTSSLFFVALKVPFLKEKVADIVLLILFFLRKQTIFYELSVFLRYIRNESETPIVHGFLVCQVFVVSHLLTLLYAFEKVLLLDDTVAEIVLLLFSLKNEMPVFNYANNANFLLIKKNG